MPTLAKSLKSGVTSIYWYFKSKDELLQALTDQVSRQIYQDLPSFGDRPWHQELFQYFVSFRELVGRSAVSREIFAYRVHFLFERAEMRSYVLRHLDAGLSYLVDAGLTLEEAADAINACSSFTRGFVVLEHGPGAASVEPSDHSREPDDRLRDISAYPLVDALGIDRMADLDSRQFERGLRLVIEGMRSEVDARMASLEAD